jgi:hypothetical protein
MKSSRKSRRGQKLKASTGKRGTGATPAQLKILELFGTIEYDPSYNYKAERKQDEIR